MNYLQEILAFNRWKEVNQLPATAIALWYELMTVCNKCGWQKDFTVPNGLLQINAGLSRKQFETARLLLIQKDRITYKKSNSVNQAGKYSIIPIVQKGQQKVHQEGQQEGQQEEHATGTLIKHKLNKNKSSSTSDNTLACEKNPFWIFENEGFGTISDLIAQRLNYMIDDYSERWVIEAMKLAIYQNKRSLSYVNGILKRWKAEGIDAPWEGGKKGEKHNGNHQPDYSKYKFGF